MSKDQGPPFGSTAFDLLDKARDGYAQAVKTWSRDALIVFVVAIVSTAFVIAPYTQSKRELTRVHAEEEKSLLAQNELAALRKTFDSIQETIGSKESALREAGREGAQRLSARLKRFGQTVRALLGKQPTEPFPGSNSNEQFASNGPSPIDASESASELLTEEYGLTLDDIERIKNSEHDPEPTTQIVARVFHNEITHTYDELSATIKATESELRDQVTTTLASAEALASRCGITLPDPSNVLPHPLVLTRPSDDRLFNTRDRKAAMIDAGMLDITHTITEAATPLNTLGSQVKGQAECMASSLAALRTSKEGYDESLKALDAEMDTFKKDLMEISGPLAWLPTNLDQLIALSPLIMAGCFFVLAVRLSRLRSVARMIDGEFRRAGASEGACAIAFCVPEAAVEPLTGSRIGSFRRISLTARGLLGSLLILLGIVSWMVLVRMPSAGPRNLVVFSLTVLATLSALASIAWNRDSGAPDTRRSSRDLVIIPRGRSANESYALGTSLAPVSTENQPSSDS